MKSKIVRMMGPQDSDSTPKEMPSLPQIVAAVKALNGRNNTMVVLWSAMDDYRMVVGGGPAHYICYVTKDELVFEYLKNEAAGGNKIEVIAGGQMGEYDGIYCVDKNAVLLACEHFFATGKCDPALKWFSK